MHSEGSSPPELDRRQGQVNLNQPIPTAPIYQFGDWRQWLSLAVDKGFAAAVAFYVLSRMEAVLTQLRDVQMQNSQTLEYIRASIERLPR